MAAAPEGHQRTDLQNDKLRGMVDAERGPLRVSSRTSDAAGAHLRFGRSRYGRCCRRHGIAPDSMLYGTLMSVAGRAGDTNLAFSLQNDMLAEGIVPCQARGLPDAPCRYLSLTNIHSTRASPALHDALPAIMGSHNCCVVIARIACSPCV